MEPLENLKIFGLLSVIIIVLAGSFMVWKGPRDKSKSVSFHAASAKKKLYVLYALAFITATILFYLFCTFWFIPTFNLSFSFTFILNLMTILLILTAIIPEAGKKIKTHAVVAYGFALCMLLLLLIVVFSSKISLLMRIFSGFSVGYMTLGWYLFFLYKHKEKVRLKYLVYQYLYIILFSLSILGATYIR